MVIGDVFVWEQYPYNYEGKQKRRWFIYLGAYRYTPDPLNSDYPVMIIAPTTTTQTHYYEIGSSRSTHPHVRFKPEENFGFSAECVLDLAIENIVAEHILMKAEKDGQIEIKGNLPHTKLREIYTKICDSQGYSPIAKRQIRDNLNRAGVTGLPKVKRRKRGRSR
ncbi:MAG: hypothetical protein PHS04_17480 [Tissierellia bacterium]|nr:hypothetical protein [Tissierellia bacterium]